MSRRRPPSTPPDAAALRDLARGIGARVRDPADVVAVLRSRKVPDWPQWSPTALSGSPMTVALLLSELHLDDPEGGWERSATEWAGLALRALRLRPSPDAGWCAGSAGVVLALSSVARWHADPEVTGARDDTISLLRRQVRALVERLPARATDLGDYDLLSGVAGVVPGLVAARELGADVRSELDAVARTLTAYGTLRDGFPGCRLDPATYAETEDRFPDGYVDLGLAHGVPGVLAALAVLRRRAPEASCAGDHVVADLAAWLLQHAAPDEAGPNWALGIGVGERPGSAPRARARAGWCYGVPGVALALHRAGEALDDVGLRGTARDVLATVARRPSSATRLESATICHGSAGVALVAAELGVDGLDPWRTSVLDSWDDDAPLGVRDTGASGMTHDDPGLLTGACGVGLAALHLAGAPVPALTATVLMG